MGSTFILSRISWCRIASLRYPADMKVPPQQFVRWSLRHDGTQLPSRERVHIPPTGEKKTHRLKSTFGNGYDIARGVSSWEELQQSSKWFCDVEKKVNCLHYSLLILNTWFPILYLHWKQWNAGHNRIKAGRIFSSCLWFWASMLRLSDPSSLSTQKKSTKFQLYDTFGRDYKTASSCLSHSWFQNSPVSNTTSTTIWDSPASYVILLDGKHSKQIV